MRLSLRARLSLFTAVIIVAAAAVSAYIFLKNHLGQIEEQFVSAGSAYTYALSKSAEQGLIEENLNLLDRAAYLVERKNVGVIQVYNNLWEAVDAYPFERLKEAPDPEALEFYATGTENFFYGREGFSYDFYRPVLFSPAQGSPPMAIGYVRIVMSAAEERGKIFEMTVATLAVTGALALVSILSINFLVGRLVIRPVLRLHSAAEGFRSGVLPAEPITSSTAEINELCAEFHHMCRELKEKERGLVESEARMKSFFNRVEQAIFRLDPEGGIVETNSNFRALFGPADRLCEVIVGEADNRQCIERARLEGGIIQQERQVVDQSGEERTILLSLYPEAREGAGITGYDGYMIDITEKKKLEEGLVRAQKLEAIGTLTGGLAHDFNNILAAILGYSEMILDATQEGDQLNRYAGIVHQAAERGADITARILAASRKEKARMRSVDANEVVLHAVELLERSMPKSITVSRHLAPALPAVHADPSQLEQAVMNLALNARDAMPGGGTLTVETAHIAQGGGAGGRVGHEGQGFVKISVSDTGEGMTKSVQAKAFDPFFTTKGPGKGTGLGLYMVYFIVHNHGGHINLYSEPGRGTRFSVYLPAGAAAPAEAPAQHGEDIKGSGTLLVVDDEAFIREMLKDMLTPLGYEVLLAPGGSEGVRMYEENLGRISLVVLDMVMPDMDGATAFRRLRAVDPQARVLLCSGFSQNGFAGIDQLVADGAAGFVQKPFNRASIAASIKRALAS